MRVYIAGPLGSGDAVKQNVERAIEAADAVMRLGLRPFVPHLFVQIDERYPRPYEEWIAIDLAWLDACDVLLRLHGVSPGADREVAHMRASGRPVFHGIDELAAWVARRAA